MAEPNLTEFTSPLAFDPRENPKLIDADDRIVWKEVRRAVEQVGTDHSRVIELEKGGLRIRVRYIQAGTKAEWSADSVNISIAEIPLETPRLIVPN